jgi:hypothetical protein
MKHLALGMVLGFSCCAATQAAWLGAALATQPDGSQAGVRVHGVAEGSPAAQAGLREGDLIVSAHSQPVASADDLARRLQAASVGAPVRLGLVRRGKPHAVTAVLAAAPVAAADAKPAPSGAVLPRGGVPLAVAQSGHCSAYVPAGWTLRSHPQGAATDLVSGDRRAYAGWGVRQVNRAMQPFYGALHGDPDTAAAHLAGQILQAHLGDGEPPRYTGAPQAFLGYFTLRRFETARSRGLVFYRAYPGLTPQEYVASSYFAIADKSLGSAGLMVASGVATSIRCQTQLVPRRDPGPPQRTGGRRAGCGGEGALRGYNKELGHQSAHSSSTGENFLLDAATQWQENGPQGAGYYKQNGNFQEKLELGRSDDEC